MHVNTFTCFLVIFLNYVHSNPQNPETQEMEALEGCLVYSLSLITRGKGG
jgi:hypothetical protein